MVGQLIQKKQEEKQIEEEQAANARYWKIPAFCDDVDDYNSAITPNEPINSLKKQIQEDQAANARYWKIPAYYDDDDDYNFSITLNEPVDSLSIGDEHLNTIPEKES
nr:hypothetical protein [Tanacetum cinerariifolium]